MEVVSKKIFSLIIPCHNPEKTIIRLFDSIARQEVSNDDLEIIVVDDNSDSLDYREKLKTYGFNLIFTETNTNTHCPGNTRRKGMEYVSGQWVFFADQDDFFEDSALLKVKDYILSNKENTMYVVSTIMRAYNPEADKCHHDFAHKQAWLHGKWYSVDNLIRPYNVNFKEDLVTHEDVYFNSLVISTMVKLESDWDYLDIYTYRWVDNPESITRRTTKDRGYLYEHFNDYIVSAGEPYWKGAKNTNDPFYMNQIMMTLLHAYFYYEAVSYYDGAKDYVDVAMSIKNLIYQMVNDLNYSLDFIVDYIYMDPYKYDAVMEDCRISSGKFIPKTSFRDFVYRLGKDIKEELNNG